MTNITWKNGGPLFLQPAPGSDFGLVAADQDCCCPPPPPPRCWDCLDMCAYFIEITAPTELAVKSPAYQCVGSTGYGSVIVPYMLLGQWPDDIEPSTGNPTSFINNSYSAAANYVPYQWLTASVSHNLTGRGVDPIDTGECGTFSDARFSSDAAIYCTVKCTPGQSSPFSVELQVFINVILDSTFQLNNGGSGYCQGFWNWNASATFPLTSTCESSSSRQCTPTEDEFQTLSTPVSFSASGATTSLGDYGPPTEFMFGDYGSTAKSIGESIREALTATFRITSRPSCQTAECDCSTNLQGTSWLFSQGNLSRDCQWNTTDQDGDKSFQEWGSSPFYIYWDGNGSFYLERFDPDTYVTGIGGFTTERHTTEFVCTTIDGVPTWTVTITSECIRYNNVPTQTHHSIDTWVGKLLCYESCEDNYHAAGVPLPTGELVDVEYIGRWTETGYSECTPPSPLTVFGRQLVAPC